MSKLVPALVAAAVAGWVVAGSATGASAHYGHGKCAPCGPLPPTIHVHTINTYKSITRVHDRSVYQHLPRYHRIVNITRIQPIVHITNLTRIHHHKVYYIKDTYASQTIHLRPIIDMRSSVINTYDGCGCH